MKRPPKRKVTLALDVAVAEEIRRAVEAGRAYSQSGLVEEAVVEYLAAKELEALRAAYARAAADSAFLADVDQVTKDFAPLDEQADVE